jgi:hypothetical protein
MFTGGHVMPALHALISFRGLLASVLAGAAVAVVIVGAERYAQPSIASPFTICPASARADFPGEMPYLVESQAGMNRMMSDMAVKPTGDVDRDFVSMMVPHHQGAIDMARAVLRSGHNEQIKRLAQEIIITQQQEIAVMRLAVGDPLPPSTTSPAQLADSAVHR